MNCKENEQRLLPQTYVGSQIVRSQKEWRRKNSWTWEGWRYRHCPEEEAPTIPHNAWLL